MNPMQRIVNLRARPEPLAAARILIGINCLFASFEAWRTLSRLLAPLVVKIPLLPSVPLLPQHALPLFITLWLCAALAFTIGWRTRIAGSVLTLVAGYTLILDQQMYSNHLYLLVLVTLLTTIADSGAAWSVDARRYRSRDSVTAWPSLLLKLQITFVYFFSAAAKITPQYLGGEILLRSLKQEGWLAVPQSCRTPAVMALLAVGSIAVELFIAFGLWSPRLRRFAMITGVGFHLLILALVASSRLSLAIFALSMFAGYILFLEDEEWDRGIHWAGEVP